MNLKGLGKRLLKRKVGIGIVAIQAIISAVLLFYINRIGALPTLFIVGIALILLLLVAAMVVLQGSKGKVHYPAKAISIMLSMLFVVGCVVSNKVYRSLDAATGVKTKSELMSVIVLKDNEASKIEDLKDETFGVVAGNDKVKNENTIEQISEKLNATVEAEEYVDSISLVEALYAEKLNVIIMNNAYYDIVEEKYEDFRNETKVIASFDYVSDVDLNKTVTDITTEPFNVYISGIDAYGEVDKTSRSDVNIIATVNPVTKTILLTSTPRDYFVPLSISNGMEDKLTHAGLYGVECSVDTLEMLYGMEIDYYVKMNFTGFIDIVDALGGVTVHSDYTFTNDKGMKYYEGDNELDGTHAMWFVRERHSFASGDLQRNKNQQYLIKAIIDKVSSPAILSGFNSLMNSVSKYLVTNMELSDIMSLVNMQLADGSKWTVEMNGVSGEGGKRYTYSNQSSKAYVMYVDEEQVAEATQKMQNVMDGKDIDDTDEVEPTVEPTTATDSAGTSAN